MRRLSSRERLLRSFENKDVDKIPISPFIYENFIKEFYNDPKADIIRGTIDVYNYFGFDIMHRNINIRYNEFEDNCINWKTSQKEDINGSTTLITTIITTPEREMKQVVQYENLTKFQKVKATKEWFIKEEEDFEQFVKFQPPVPKLKLKDLKMAKQLIGDNGITAPWISGVFNYITDYRKLDDVLVDAIVSPDFYKSMCEYFLKRIIEHVMQVLDEGVDVLSYSGNIAGGSLVGPRFFEENILQYEKSLINYIQSRGTHVLYHNCGDARNMIDMYNDLGISAFESMTEKPYADNDLKDAVERFNPNITLIGNIDQVSFLRQAGVDEVKNQVREKLNIVGNRKGFILGTSDFLEENTPYENLFAMVQAAETYITK